MYLQAYKEKINFCELRSGYSPLAAILIKLIYPAAKPSLPDVEKPFSSSGFAVKAAKLENKKGFSTLKKAWITRLAGWHKLQSTYHCQVNTCCLHDSRMNCPLSTGLPNEQMLIYPAAG